MARPFFRKKNPPQTAPSDLGSGGKGHYKRTVYCDRCEHLTNRLSRLEGETVIIISLVVAVAVKVFIHG
jgi:hypothetical protein